jgi:hypothetical protein
VLGVCALAGQQELTNEQEGFYHMVQAGFHETKLFISGRTG